jgi:hypothetical protein
VVLSPRPFRLRDKSDIRYEKPESCSVNVVLVRISDCSPYRTFNFLNFKKTRLVALINTGTIKDSVSQNVVLVPPLVSERF